MAGHGIFERLHSLGPNGDGTDRINAHIFNCFVLAAIGSGGFSGTVAARKAKIIALFGADENIATPIADGQPWGNELADLDNMVDYAAGLAKQIDRVQWALGVMAASNVAVQRDVNADSLLSYDDWADAAFGTDIETHRQDVEGWTRPTP